MSAHVVPTSGICESRMLLRTTPPLGIDPAGIEPAGETPSPIEPAGIEPAGIEPAGMEPAGIEPAGMDPAGMEPAGIEPAGAESSCAPEGPVPVIRKSTLSTCFAASLIRLTICCSSEFSDPCTTSLPPVYCAIAAWQSATGYAMCVTGSAIECGL